MSPFQARLAVASFLLISVSIAVNVAYLQDAGTRAETSRAKLDKIRRQASLERERRLSLAGPEPAPGSGLVLAAASMEPPAYLPLATGLVPRSHQHSNEPAVPSGPAIMPAPVAGVPATTGPAVMGPAPQGQELVKAVQLALARRGYAPGRADGVAGAHTRAAIMAFEHDNDLPVTADVTEQLFRSLESRSFLSSLPRRQLRIQRSWHAERITLTVQHALARLGIYLGPLDGRMSEQTARAIREFEVRNLLAPSGRVSSPLMTHLAKSIQPSRTSER
jgi:peptidoglycan hydrolase-like protein with peptidoglycan-binding domain